MNKLTQKKYLKKFGLTLESNTFTGVWRLWGYNPDIDIYFGITKPNFNEIKQIYTDTIKQIKYAVEYSIAWELSAIKKCDNLIKEVVKELKGDK